MQQGKTEQASSYIRSGQGLQLSDTLRRDLRTLEDQLEDQLTTINDLAGSLSQQAFYGLWIALGGVLTLGGIGSVILARSVTRPITLLHLVTTALDTRASPAIVREALASLRLSKDEFGQLATAYVEMADRIGTQIRELEVLSTIGQDINTIGPDGTRGGPPPDRGPGGRAGASRCLPGPVARRGYGVLARRSGFRGLE